MMSFISAMPPGSWSKINLNTYQSVWPSDDYLAPFGLGISKPDATIRAWSSFAWDDSRCKLILFGGGHANSASNGTWVWNAYNRKWQIGFYDSDLAASQADTIDGALNSPVSSHTYQNQVYLPIADKFCSFGGACQPSGSGWVYKDGSGTTIRSIICYLLDLANAGKGMVGGTTGSNVKRSSTASLSLQGAQAWQARDWVAVGQALASNMYNRVNGWAQSVVEGGKDVVYISTWGGGGTSLGLLRVEFNSNAATDNISIIGIPWNNDTYPGGGAIDTYRGIALSVRGNSTYLFDGWNMNTPGTGNKNFRVPITAVTGTGISNLISSYTSGYAPGICYDSYRQKFIMWCGGGVVLEVIPPNNLANLETSGWVCNTINDNSSSYRPLAPGEYPTTSAQETGVHGKWKRSETLDVFIGLQHCFEGNVWIYKPNNWTPLV